MPVVDPKIVRPVTDPDLLGKPAGWQQHGVASVQWALSALEVMELARAYLPEWEKAPGKVVDRLLKNNILCD